MLVFESVKVTVGSAAAVDTTVSSASAARRSVRRICT
jgi:hypothetical protein